MALLRRRPKQKAPAVCAHEQRDPRWDRMEDAGVAARIDHYVCRACGARLPRGDDPNDESGEAA